MKREREVNRVEEREKLINEATKKEKDTADENNARAMLFFF